MGSNREHFGPGPSLDAGVDPALVDIAFDPQTSGGLLAAVRSLRAADAVRGRRSRPPAPAAPSIGRVSATAGAFRVTAAR